MFYRTAHKKTELYLNIMETLEHTQAGNLILVNQNQIKDNPYLQGGTLAELVDGAPLVTPLKVSMMKVDDKALLEPLVNSTEPLTMTAGEIVATAGDYLTSPGWAKQLKLPKGPATTAELYHQSARLKITQGELSAFSKSYAPFMKVSRKEINHIYAIAASNGNEILEQLEYEWTTPGYLHDLKNNEAHFSPWSTRVYIVGHTYASMFANIAYSLKQAANQFKIPYGDTFEPNKEENKDVVDHYFPNNTITNSRTLQIIANCYRELTNTTDPKNTSSEQDIESHQRKLLASLVDIGHRYHALAVSMELSCLHYYSDHFAAGHSARIGLMRERLPNQFGFIGQVLVNSMHGEDNALGVQVSYERNIGQFTLPTAPNDEQGDKSYDEKVNDKSANLLVSGMTASLSDINTIATTGQNIAVMSYGGAGFLPHVAPNSPQHQSMFILSQDKTIYVRKQISQVKTLSPELYQATEKQPESFPDLYQPLTKTYAAWLAFKFRVAATILNFFSWPVRALAGEHFIGKADFTPTLESGTKVYFKSTYHDEGSYFLEGEEATQQLLLEKKELSSQRSLTNITPNQTRLASQCATPFTEERPSPATLVSPHSAVFSSNDPSEEATVEGNRMPHTLSTRPS